MSEDQIHEIEYETYQKIRRMAIGFSPIATFSTILAFIANGAGSLGWIELPGTMAGTMRFVSLLSSIGVALSLPMWLLDRWDLRRGKAKFVWKIEKDKWDAKTEVQKYLEK